MIISALVKNPHFTEVIRKFIMERMIMPAERLRSYSRGFNSTFIERELDAALAEERRNVIEQIRELAISSGTHHPDSWFIAQLDDLSTPEQER